ncbi:MAG: thermonuclease family protein [Alphaproteobacteria bacterium]|nr:thermonuclease family protein [Alphaproteobacteria bacterium]
MTSAWRRRRARPSPSLSRSLGIIVVALVLLLAMRQAGWFAPETGAFTAIDGDSLRKDGQEYRLNGIDAPELNQICRDASGRDYPCGREAREALRKLVGGHGLDCMIMDTDHYGRAVAVCRANGHDINGEMVKQGWAIAYRRHSLSYVGEEDDARRARRGLWQGQFEDPEDWRTSHRHDINRGELAPD